MLSEDLLPQPYRLVNKILQGILSNALDEIGRRLQQGCVVDKQFAPPRTLPTTRVFTQHIATGSSSTAAATTTTTCCQLGVSETIFGLSDGRIKIVASDGDEPEFISEPLVDDGSPVVAVASSRPLYHEPIYAVAFKSTVAIVAVDIRDATPPPSTVPVAGFAGVVLRRVCSVPSELLDGRNVSSLQLALDGRTLAVGVDADALVYAFELPPPPPLTTTTAAGTAEGDAAAQASAPCVERLFIAAPPANAVAPTPDATGRAVFNFFCRSDAASSGALGYYHEQRALRPLHAASLLVAWCGTNVISRFPLGAFYEGVQDRIADAKAALADAANQAQQAALAAAALASNATGGKGGKGDKGAKPSASPSGGAGAGAGGDGGAAGTAASGVVLYPESFFSGRRDTHMPRTIVTAVFNNERSLCAIGCLDGIVAIHDGRSVQNMYTAAAHRLQQQTINDMYPASISFLPGTNQLVVGFVVQRLPYRCFVDTYDLSVTVTNGRCTIGSSSKSGPAEPTGAVHEAALPPSNLPRGCISRMKFLHRLRAVIPIGSLPFVLLLVEGGTFLLDVTSGDVVARAQLDDGVDIYNALPPSAGGIVHPDGTTIGAAMEHAASVAAMCLVPTFDGALVVHGASFDAYRIDVAATVSELYPPLMPLLSGSYGHLSNGLFDAMLRFFYEVPHNSRAQSTHLITSFLSATQRLTELTSMQAPPNQGRTSAGGGSVTSTMLGGKGKVMSDGRLSRSSVGPSRAQKAVGGGTQTPAGGGATAAGSSTTPQQQNPTSAYQVKPSGALGSAWETDIRGHIEYREDTRHLRKERLNSFWEAMKKR